jgi:hypothetical protein
MSGAAERKQRVIESAEKMFAQPVLAVHAPGGEGRASYRLTFENRTVIATLRPNFRRTHVEAFTLNALHPICLGVDGEILYQSDVGDKRLNIEIAQVDAARKTELAYEAVSSIFRIHAAGRSQAPRIRSAPWAKPGLDGKPCRWDWHSRRLFRASPQDARQAQTLRKAGISG